MEKTPDLRVYITLPMVSAGVGFVGFLFISAGMANGFTRAGLIWAGLGGILGFVFGIFVWVPIVRRTFETVVQPPQIPQTIQIRVRDESQGKAYPRELWFDLPPGITREDIEAVAKKILTDKLPFSYALQNYIGRGKYEKIRDLFLSQGMLVHKGNGPTVGVALTPLGRSTLRKFIGDLPTRGTHTRKGEQPRAFTSAHIRT